jgi:hypothetical protein
MGDNKHRDKVGDSKYTDRGARDNNHIERGT